MVDCDRDTHRRAAQRWLESELASSRADPDTDWIVVCMHQVVVSTVDIFNGADRGIRETWVPLFDRYRVDLVVCGHLDESYVLRRDRCIRRHHGLTARDRAAGALAAPAMVLGLLAPGGALAFGLGEREAAADLVNNGYRKADRSESRTTPGSRRDGQISKI